MLWLYRILFLPVLLVSLPRYLLRMKRRGGYRNQFGNRFGFIAPPPAKEGRKRVWVQAVSVGEVFAIAPIVRRLSRESNCEVFLTTTTSTGFALAQAKLGDYVVGIAYFPLDFVLCNWLAWKRIEPDVCVLFESEIWPEHVMRSHRRNIPLLLSNARISDRSFSRMRKAAPIVAGILEKFTVILAASESDQERFIELGAPAEKVVNAGNIKLDVNIEKVLSPEEKQQLCGELGLPGADTSKKPLLLLGSSTWPGEEEVLLRLLQAARDAGIPCNLLIVPRHAERRDEIRETLEDFPFAFHFRTDGAAPGPVDVAIGDTTGELILFTQLADVVFIGKSLPPEHQNDGGQTPIEAAALGKPLLYGPYMTNFRTIARQLVDCGGATVAGDEVDLIEQAIPLLRNAEAREKAGANAARWHASNRGAAEKTIHTLTELLES